MSKRKLPDHVDEIVNETDTDDGWWLYYKPGWSSSMDPGAMHCEHCETKRECLEMAKLAVECHCEQCMLDLGQVPMTQQQIDAIAAVKQSH